MRIKTYCYTLLVSILLANSAIATSLSPLNKLKNLDLEALANVEVTIMGKSPEKLASLAAAVTVITAEDIRRSGATRLPEVLRLIPGINYARNDTGEWAISIRGFNSRFANKLLVLIDGRSVYTPLFSGTFWESQDLLLEDIEQIEVIRGPGAATWGANAVNGVISIITRHAQDSQGTLITTTMGDEQRGIWARHGGKLGSHGYYRAYSKYHEREPAKELNGSAGQDRLESIRGGFRSDWNRNSQHTFNLQGNIYKDNAHDPELTGGNLSSFWQYTMPNGTQNRLQIYYDRTEVQTEITHDMDILDIEYRIDFRHQDRHHLTFGTGYRWTHSKTSSPQSIVVAPSERSLALFHLFGQNEISFLDDHLALTLGAKLEHHEFTAFEFQPSIRLRWSANTKQVFWAAISRAVRTPSIVEHDFSIDSEIGTFSDIPIIARLQSNKQAKSETLIAYEMGWRNQVSQSLYFDLSLFYNDYKKLSTFEPNLDIISDAETGRIITNIMLANKLQAQTYGLEAVLDWKILDQWRLQTSYAYLEMQLQPDHDSQDPQATSAEGKSPKHQISIRSMLDINSKWELDVWLRYVDKLPSLIADSYIDTDIRLSYQFNRYTTISLIGQHLFDPQHPEFGDELVGGLAQQIEREIFLQLLWQK